MFIRNETPQDHPAVYNMVQAAFKTAKIKDGDEHDFVEKMRKSGRAISELTFVATHDGLIVGHIMLSQTKVLGKNNSFEALLVAALSVVPEHHNKGLGAKLVRTALKKAAELGYTAIFLAGDRNYYSRFGFIPAHSFGIRPAHELPINLADNIMGLELVAGALNGVQGVVVLE